jgi:plastocyanin
MSRTVPAVAVTLALLFSACNGGDNTAGDAVTGSEPEANETAADETSPEQGAQADEPQEEVTVSMTDNLTFEPREIVVKVGGEVTWVNDSDMDHTSTANQKKAADKANVRLPDGADQWNSGFIKPGKSLTMTFDVPGEYHYFCIPHEKVGMLGVIEVVQ